MCVYHFLLGNCLFVDKNSTFQFIYSKYVFKYLTLRQHIISLPCVLKHLKLYILVNIYFAQTKHNFSFYLHIQYLYDYTYASNGVNKSCVGS